MSDKQDRCDECGSLCLEFPLVTLCTNCYKGFFTPDQIVSYYHTLEGLGIEGTVVFYRRLVDHHATHVMHDNERINILNSITETLKKNERIEGEGLTRANVKMIIKAIDTHSKNLEELFTRNNQIIGDYS